MKHPNIITATKVVEDAQKTSCRLPDGRLVPARSIGFQGDCRRWKAVWLVFTGKADALIWDGQP